MSRLVSFITHSSAVMAAFLLLGCLRVFAGASVPWTTYEAEDMTNTGALLGPVYVPAAIACEASGRKCIQLSATGQYIQFTAQAAANALIVRYNTPDTADGKGADSTISLYINGVFAQKIPLTSRLSWLYGNYPFVNTPASGQPRNFFDEARVKGLAINAGDTIRLEQDAGDTATNTIDLVDLENIAPALGVPANSFSITDYGAAGNGSTDDTSALTNCIAQATAQGKTVWLPPGDYLITRAINLPSNLTLQGAGMWYTTLVGSTNLYTTASRRVMLNGNGSNIHIADFSIFGKLNYRNDGEANDGLGGKYGSGSSISRVWVEHTKVGAWILNSLGLVVDGCRFRDTIADGINLNLGMRSTVVTNCTTRGGGDDCFAMWPASGAETYIAGLNVFTHCTGTLPFLANGGAIYGGFSNRVEDCRFQDISYGCGILVSTTFAVGSNSFTGITTAQRCDVFRSGGYDPSFTWRGAVQIAVDKKINISGVNFNNLNIIDSISDGLGMIAPGSNSTNNQGTLSNATFSNLYIPNYGLALGGRHGLWARYDMIGSVTVSNSALVESQDDSVNFTMNIVSPAAPTLGIAQSGTNVVVSWPALFTNFTLRTNSDVTTVNWQPVANVASNIGGLNTVSLPRQPGNVFFRLQNP